ncbi:MAG: CRISPR-associated endonuclease Cas1, partial [Alphaproteobacteria bacterium]|nr:CRISPR-associated endonuclease Cas1 [Alphaproteobacteria bacterium]
MVDRIAAGTLSGLMTANAWPLVVRSHEAKVTKDGGRLLVLVDGEPPVAMRLAEISQLVVMGGATVTTPAVHALLRQGTPICWHGRDGWFLGMTQGLPASGAAARIAQYRVAEDPVRAVALARALVSAKVRNARARLRDRR